MAGEGVEEMTGGFGGEAGCHLDKQESKDSEGKHQIEIFEDPPPPPPPLLLDVSASATSNSGSGQRTRLLLSLPPSSFDAGGRQNSVEHQERRSSGRTTHGVNQEQTPQTQTQNRSHRRGHIDEKWPEVMIINNYAVFMGYLSMAVKGIGFLVLTWSTVVLLGGFVTMLAKKDFWCLTVITLVQTGIFDVFLNGNISYIGYSARRLTDSALSIAFPRYPFWKWSVRSLLRVLVFTIVLCPLFALYMFGLFVSPGIALWRLVQRDYGDTARDSSKANLMPALVVLYSLALLQGVLFYFKYIYSFEEQRLLKLVAREYWLHKDDKARGSISDYLSEIGAGCEKDPSFARGKNLVTYAAGLMQSSSPDSYLSGARIIDTLIQQLVSIKENLISLNAAMAELAASFGDDHAVARIQIQVELDRAGIQVELERAGIQVYLDWTRALESLVESQHMLMNNMIGSASSDAIKKFVHMLDSRSESDSAEMRQRAMRIVAHFACEIRLSKIPYAIQCVSSFLSNPDAAAHQHKETSIDILLKLTDDEENLRLMSNTNNLALKIIKILLDSDGIFLHNTDHGRWCSKIAVPGMEIISRFTSVTNGSNNMQLAREILESTDAISTLQRMLNCQQCKRKKKLKKSLIMVLTKITSMEISLAVGDEVKLRLDGINKTFIDLLIAIFRDSGDGRSSMKKLAGESLAQLSRVKENSATILGANNVFVVDILTNVVLDKNSEYRKSAADILKHLCSHYTTDGGPGFEKLKDTMTNVDGVIPEVLREVLGSMPYNVEEQQALQSLCATVHARLIKDQDQSLVNSFDAEAKEIYQGNMPAEITFAGLVEKAERDVANRTQSWTEGSDETPGGCCIS